MIQSGKRRPPCHTLKHILIYHVLLDKPCIYFHIFLNKKQTIGNPMNESSVVLHAFLSSLCKKSCFKLFFKPKPGCYFCLLLRQQCFPVSLRTVAMQQFILFENQLFGNVFSKTRSVLIQLAVLVRNFKFKEFQIHLYT